MNIKSVIRVRNVFIALCLFLITSWGFCIFYHESVYRLLARHYSILQLFLTACVSFLTYKVMERRESLNWLHSPAARPFYLCAAGFLFLSLDDLLSIHENTDYLIHFLFRIKETALTDHLDDLILLGYGIIALFFVKDFLREFRKYPRMMTFIKWGFFFFFVMMCMDVLSNNEETFMFFFRGIEPLVAVRRKMYLAMAETSVQIVGEAFFLSGFISAYLHVKKGVAKE